MSWNEQTFPRFLKPSCLSANTAKIAVNVWEKLKVRCPGRVFFVKFEEHRFAVRQGIALLIFSTNVSKFSRELGLGFTDKCMEKLKP